VSLQASKVRLIKLNYFSVQVESGSSVTYKKTFPF